MTEVKENSNYLRTLTVTYIAIHQTCRQLPFNLCLIIIFIRQLQTISFLVLKQQDPFILVLSYTIQQTIVQYQYFIQCFILISVNICCLYFLATTYGIQSALVKSEVEESLLNMLNKQRLYTIIGNSLMIWFQELLCRVFFLPFLYALLWDIINSEGDSQIYKSLIDILCITMITLIYFIYVTVLEQSVDFSKHKLLKSNSSPIYYLILILEMIQAVCATFNDSSTVFYFICLFQFFQIFLTMYDIFINYSITNFQQLNVISLGLSIQLTVLISVLIIHFDDLDQNYYILLPLIVPITYYLFRQTLEIHIFQSLFNNSLDIKQSSFQVIYILSEDSNYWYLRALLFGKHRNTCFKVHCHCKSVQKFDLFDPVNNYYFNLQKRNIVVKLGKSIDTSMSEDVCFFFHYIIALNQLGFTTQAFQQISFIQSSDKRKIQRSLNGSMFNTNTTESRNKQSKSLGRRLESSSSHPEQINQQEDEESDNERKPIQMNFINSCRFEILSQIIRQSMSFNIGSNSQEQISTQHLVKLFVQQENNNFKVTNTIIQIFKGKIQYLRNFTKTSNDQLKNATSKLNNQLHNLHKQLLLRYEHFPSYKLQLTLTFVQAELMNDYYLAYKTMNIMSIRDEKIFDQFDITHGINFFSKDVSYLICEYETNSSIRISNCSPNCHKFFGYKLDEFKKLDNIDYLLPPTIQTLHEKFVGQFLQSGQSKYFSNCEASYCMNSSGAVENIQMLYDINYQDSKAFSFIVFVQKTKPEQIMFVSQEGMIGGISEKLVQQFGYSTIGQEEFRNLYKTTIQSIIPTFQEIVEFAVASTSNNSLTLKYSNVVVKEHVQICFPTQKLSSIPTRFEYSAQTKVSMQNYSAVIKINVQNIKGRIYYLINFLDIKNIESQSIAPSSKYDNIDMVWTLSDVSSPAPNQPKVLELKQAFQKQELIPQYPMIFERGPQDQIRGDQLDDDFYNSLMGTNRGFELTKIVDKTQQQFFGESDRGRNSSNIQNNIEQSSNIISDFQKSSNVVDQLLLKDVLQSFPKEVEIQESKQINNNNNKQSEITVSGFRSSKYFWKYTFFNRLTQERLQVQEFNKSFIFLILYFFICLGCTIMIFVITQNDFDDLLQQLKLVNMRKTIMSPFSKSLLIEIIDTEYDEVYAAGIVDSKEHDRLNNYIGARDNQAFQTLKENILGVIEDPQISGFFVDLYDEIYIADDDTQNPIIKNSSFRTQLMTVVASQQSENQWYMYNITFPTPNFENFGVANYDVIFTLMESLSSSLLSYTKQLSNNFNIKSILLTLVLIFIQILIIIISSGYQFNVIRFYEKTFELRMFIQMDFLQREIERLVLLSSMIEKNRNLIQNYHFKLEEKEEYLQYLEKTRPSQDKFIKQTVILSRSRLMMIFNHVVILSIFLAFTLGQLISSSKFFNDFNPTVEYLFDVSEIVAIMNSAYVANELSYFTSLPSYTFLGTKSDTTQREILTLSVARMDAFLGWAYSISTLPIINGDRFKSQFQLYASNNVCAIFNQTYMASADYVCDYSINGNLKLGFIPSIIFIEKIFQQELTNQNLTRTVYEYPVNQIEAALVIGDCIDVLSGYLFDDINSYTNDFQLLKHIISGVHIFYLTIFLFGLLYIVYERSYRECYQMRQYLTLNPIYTMILENQFERAIRSLVLRQEWL